MKHKIAFLFLFFAMATFSQSLTLVSPNGGESYSAGQQVTISWINNNHLASLFLLYSLDNGNSWTQINGTILTDMDSTFLWTVPHLQQRTDLALIKIAGIDYSPFDVSNGTFTIQASPPDAYEPNNDFASAYLIAIGDSVVKNATVIGMKDTLSSDTSKIDDFFRVRLSGGKLTTVSTFPRITDKFKYNNDGRGTPYIRLYDVMKNIVASGYGSITCLTQQTSDYYCRISGPVGGWSQYGLSIQQSDGTITLVSPNGGESYSAGQQVTIQWITDKHIPNVVLSYSIDNGTSWVNINGNAVMDGGSSFLWTVPHLKKRTDIALVKVIANNMFNPPSDVSNGNFTIQASPPDAYEPNDGFVSAYPIAIGDSVVKNAVVYSKNSWDSLGIDTVNSDLDFFKVTLSAGNMVTISSSPCFPVGGDANSYGGAPPIILVYDASKILIAHGEASISCGIMESGVYYCKILPENAGSWTNYGLSIKSLLILSSQNSALDTAVMQKTGDSTYTAQLVADTTKLNILLTLNRKMKGSITTAVLAPDDLALGSDAKTRVKTISISSDSAFSSSIKTADITIPYSVAELNGNSQNSLTVRWLNESTNQWTPIESAIDTVKHQVVAHSTHFSIYGVFVNSPTPVTFALQASITFGIKANFLLKRNSVAVHFSLPEAVNADLRLYDIQGKCVRKYTTTAAPGASTLAWDLGALANGKYFLSMKAGMYSAKQTILIMN